MQIIEKAVRDAEDIITKKQYEKAQEVFNLLLKMRASTPQTTRIGRTVRSTIRKLLNFAQFEDIDTKHGRVYTNKTEFLGNLEIRFIHNGMQATLRDHLRDGFLGETGSWHTNITYILESYNKAKEPVPRVPTNFSTLGLCLLGDRNIRLTKEKFKAICFPDMGKTLGITQRKAERKRITNNEIIQILHSNADYIGRLVNILGESKPGSFWLDELIIFFREINISMQNKLKKLPTSRVGISRVLVGKNSMTKDECRKILIINKKTPTN